MNENQMQDPIRQSLMPSWRHGIEWREVNQIEIWKKSKKRQRSKKIANLIQNIWNVMVFYPKKERRGIFGLKVTAHTPLTPISGDEFYQSLVKIFLFRCWKKKVLANTVTCCCFAQIQLNYRQVLAFIIACELITTANKKQTFTYTHLASLARTSGLNQKRDGNMNAQNNMTMVAEKYCWFYGLKWRHLAAGLHSHCL